MHMFASSQNYVWTTTFIFFHYFLMWAKSKCMDCMDDNICVLRGGKWKRKIKQRRKKIVQRKFKTLCASFFHRVYFSLSILSQEFNQHFSIWFWSNSFYWWMPASLISASACEVQELWKQEPSGPLDGPLLDIQRPPP